MERCPIPFRPVTCRMLAGTYLTCSANNATSSGSITWSETIRAMARIIRTRAAHLSCAGGDPPLPGHTLKPVELAVELWRCQTVRPYITIIDTGSTDEHRNRIAQLQAEDVEIHYIRGHGYLLTPPPASQFQSAQDVALALCQQEYQFNTHSDVFPVRRDLIDWYIGQCSRSCPASRL